MGNNYDAFSELQNATLQAAGFLRATAARVLSSGLPTEEIVSRLNDQADILAAANTKAQDKFFLPDKS